MRDRSRRLRPNLFTEAASTWAFVRSRGLPGRRFEPGLETYHTQTATRECLYAPVDLNDPHLLAQDGGRALGGRSALSSADGLCSCHDHHRALRTRAREVGALGGGARAGQRRLPIREQEHFVRWLRIYPHALREANAYYSPKKVALLFRFLGGLSERGGSIFHGGVHEYSTFVHVDCRGEDASWGSINLTEEALCTVRHELTR